jgi:DMSO/TMAO reductase YedYZ heme-binding membrane subunit
MHSSVNTWTDLLVVTACTLFIVSTTFMSWLMNKAPAQPRRILGVAFFALLAAHYVDYLIGYLNIYHHEIGKTWHMIVLRLALGVVGCAFAAVLYRDLGGMKRHE